jgi:broad specificity phosphatase PhoE
MSSEVLLFRHFEDYQEDDNYRDGSIKELDKSQEILIVDSLMNALIERDINSIVFLASPQRRVRESIELVSSRLDERMPINTYLVEEDRIRPIDHGEYIKLQDEDMKVAERNAWDAFVEQTFTLRNMLYRHGDPMIDQNGSARYPELVGRFKTHGENQLDFTIRTYSFILDVLETYNSCTNKNEMVVIGSHMAPLMRLAEIAKLSQRDDFNNSDHESDAGSLYISEWNEVASVVDDIELGKITHPGGLSLFDLDKLKNILPLIEPELRHLEIIKADLERKTTISLN